MVARKSKDGGLVAWLDALGRAEGHAPAVAVSIALVTHPEAIDALYRAFVDETPAVGRAQMLSELCRRVSAKTRSP